MTTEQQPMSTAIYEDLKPKQELKEEREAFILLVHIPTGFERQHYGAKVEFDYSRVRVFGEQPLENNKIKRFSIVHQVPTTCDINRITGKVLDGSIVSIKMPKKVPSDPVPQAPQITESESENEQQPKTSPEAKPGEHDTEQEATIGKEEPKTSTQAEAEAEAGEDNDEPDGPPPQQEKVAAEAEIEEGKKEISDHDHEEPKSSKFDDSVDDEKPNLEREGKEESEEDVKKSSEEAKAIREGGSLEVIEKERSEEKESPSSSSLALGGLKGMVTGFANRFDEEDKRRVIYMGAAVVVVALGVYASYKFRSSSLLRK